MKLNDDEKTVRGWMSSFPAGEIIGGSEREANSEILESRMRALKQSETIGGIWIFGASVPSPLGFGLGFERAVNTSPEWGTSAMSSRSPKSAEF